jgi:hypothetical protein
MLFRVVLSVVMMSGIPFAARSSPTVGMTSSCTQIITDRGVSAL